MSIRLPSEIETKYEVLAIMGEGGMGAVYKVRHRYLDEVQVIKVMREKLQTDEDLKARFLREAKTAKKLRHPNIAEVIDYSVTSEGTAYIVMEYIEGVNLREVMKQLGGALDPALVVDAGLQTLSALGYLHDKGFVHRDISPDNLMLTRRDGKTLVKLIDLGIAKAIEGTSKLTMDGSFVGKVQYASPEQFAGGDIDRRSDLYSLGISLYELLTGAAPISGTDYRAIIAGHLTRPPRSFDETDPQGLVSLPVREAILKALQKDPDDRYVNAETFAGTLQSAFETASRPDADPTLATVELEALFRRISERQTQAGDPSQVTVDLSKSTSDDPSLAVTRLPEATLDRSPATAPHDATSIVPGGKITEPDLGGGATLRLDTLPGQRRSWRAAIIILTVLMVGVAALLLLKQPQVTGPAAVVQPGQEVTVTGGQAATGELIIKGLPWGEVVEVIDSAGRNRVPMKPLYTPAALTLPPGSYRVLLSNPLSKQAATVTAEVRALSSVMCEAKLDDVDAASYLKRVIR